MALTDDYAQGVPYAVLDDGPNAQTLGEGIVNGLTPLSNMRFNSASNRGSVLTSPVAGMVTFLRDTGRLEYFDGSAWVTVASGSSAWTTVDLVSPWTHDGNSNGDLAYKLVSDAGEDTIRLRGAISRASYPTSPSGGFTITSSALPTVARPSVKQTVNVTCSVQNSDRISLQMDLTTAGHIVIWGLNSTTKPPWIAFSGISLPLT